MAVHYGLVLLHIILLLCPIIKAKERCPNQCGGVNIRYPFGIGEGCYFDKSFEVVCDNNSTRSPKALLKSINLELSPYMSNGSGLAYISVNISVIRLNRRKSTSHNINAKGVNLSGTPFSFSQTDNRFIAIGCNSYAQQIDSSWCRPICTCNPTQNSDCCNMLCNIPQSSIIIKVLDAYSSYVYSQNISQVCTSVSVVYLDWFFSNYLRFPNVLENKEYVSAKLEWGKTGGSTCSEEYNLDTSCNQDGYCLVQLGSGYFCLCNDRRLSGTYPDLCEGYLMCNTTSGYNCSECPRGYYSSGCTIGGLGMLSLLTGTLWLYKFFRRRGEIKLKHKFFKRNGGLLLQQELSSNEGGIDKTKLFTSNELEKATDNFNTNRILGQGGQGTVYKGMLEDGKIVAVKKSKIIDESKVEEFINEVVILSQINHRNVVKLLGCCLETEVPLLVYEFISNGTLSQYIDDQNKDFRISWEMRLCIAIDVSGAISYLHSAASIPIYHRDIKSTNILLDDKYCAKVSDFGASRSIAVDQTHLTTQVQGTFGYLDPEYFQSSHFTEKSDVYSFGVVLVELLTGERPIRLTNSEEDKSLAAYFLRAMREDRLFEILDAQILKEGGKDEFKMVAKLAKRCLNLNGKKRPTMREVGIELTGIRGCNGASNIVHQGCFEEIHCVDGGIAETSEIYGSVAQSISESTISKDADPLISND
ncbi:hypothetical protein WN944_014687 [Citrus x changshan-huyou]|uniref:Protein kinase domain-containing protein n=1 Tax=Citrus x changshan-huyou TaxID=2935761 RepID=A0AAP0MAA3_9ROSI